MLAGDRGSAQGPTNIACSHPPGGVKTGDADIVPGAVLVQFWRAGRSAVTGNLRDRRLTFSEWFRTSPKHHERDAEGANSHHAYDADDAAKARPAHETGNRGL